MKDVRRKSNFLDPPLPRVSALNNIITYQITIGKCIFDSPAPSHRVGRRPLCMSPKDSKDFCYINISWYTHPMELYYIELIQTP